MLSDFNFIIPAEVIEKSYKDKDGSVKKDMYIKGIASTDDQDIEGETLEPSGYNLDVFLKNGTLNYEHLSKRSPKYIIGEPINAYIKDNKMFLEGKLWSNSEIARDVYNKIKEMGDSGTDRRAGFSIEGKVLARDPINPKRITKALITNCAITFSPVNGNALIDIVKGTQKEDYVDLQYDQDTEDKDFIFEFDKDGKKFRVGKDYKVYEVIKKAMDVAAVKPLTPESLDKKPKNLALGDIKKSIDNVLKYSDLFKDDISFKLRIKDLLKK